MASRKRLTLGDVGSMLEHVVQHMATKEDLEEINKTLDAHTKTLGEHTKILGEHTKILGEHTRDLNTIKNDVKVGLDKRLQLEVRVTRLEKKVGV
ncbi:hypothetical protein A3I47_01350 [Candidatus Kaiserbacteria bacterium RIFCSPLOWO2_02_FULL_59_19]|nr:MAG: hypothetical protein A3I47_01350 [Candidatus Kaiserbacteria bacterium RIFCSPLOWO2_02_FULL_59_19]